MRGKSKRAYKSASSRNQGSMFCILPVDAEIGVRDDEVVPSVVEPMDQILLSMTRPRLDTESL